MGISGSKDSAVRTRYMQDYLNKFDSQEVELLHKIYKELSSRSNYSGIDKETFLHYFNLPGLWGEQLFRKFDVNSSGAVELDEFLVGISVSCRGTRSEKIYVLFKLFDLDNDNLIHKFELLAMLSNFPKLTKFLYTSIDNSDTKFNTRNRNLKISEQEYKQKNNIFKTQPILYAGDQEISASVLKTMFHTNEMYNGMGDSMNTAYANSMEHNLVGSNSSSTEKLSRSLSDFSLDSLSMSLYLNKYYTDYSGDYLYDHNGPNENRAKPKLGFRRSRSFSNESDEKGEMKLYSQKHRQNYRDMMSLESETTGSDFDNKSFTFSENSNETLSDTDAMEVDREENEPGGASLINNIINEYEEQEYSEKSNLDLEILVDQIYEECEFNQKGALDFKMFKAWLDKNDTILTMFSECLHEETWGLNGNAFNYERNYSNDSHTDNSFEYSYKSTLSENSDDKISKNGYDLDDFAMRAIYHTFLLKGKHAFENTVESNDQGLVGDELLERMKSMTEENGKELMSMEKTSEFTTLENTDKLVYEVFVCPNCKTPFLMCPVCYKKHNTLSLHIEAKNIYIRCSSCSTAKDNQIGVYKSCWICCWSFDEVWKSIAYSSNSVSSDNLNSTHSEHSATPKYSSVSNRKSSFNADASTMSMTKSCSESNSSHMKVNIGTKSGVMYKVGKKLHQWKSRYYVLIGNILYYYKDERSTRPRGCIFLEGCYLDTLKKKQIGNKHGFCICHKGKKMAKRELYVESMDEFLNWIEILTEKMKQQTLSANYEMFEQLGQGKFSIVYKAVHKITGQEYAVKIINKNKITPQERELLRSEISILKILKHSNVISLKEIIDKKEKLYIIMEMVKGGELYDLIRSEHRLSEEHTHRIVTQLLQTVGYLHKCGIIHRDLKPENVLLTDKSLNASIKLTDFGLSTLCGPNDMLTQPCGTLAYVAPEVLTMEGYNLKSDVWSIGVIMYLMIRGRLPFAIKKSSSINVWDHYKVNFEGAVWKTVSSSAKDLIKKLLEIDPERRPSIAEALNHIWVKNFAAVNYEAPSLVSPAKNEQQEEFDEELKNTTHSTFLIPYSKSCYMNLNKLQKAIK